MTGNQVAHPPLISLTNIIMDFWMKVSNHTFLLFAILPVPKFLHMSQKIWGVLENHFIIKPLKKAVEIRNHDDGSLWLALVLLYPTGQCHCWYSWSLDVCRCQQKHIPSNYGDIQTIWWFFSSWTTNSIHHYCPAHQNRDCFWPMGFYDVSHQSKEISTKWCTLTILARLAPGRAINLPNPGAPSPLA